MNQYTYELKFIICSLCDAMHRNINDSFRSVSFRKDEKGEIQVKVILDFKTDKEEEFVDDIIAEFEVLLQSNCVKETIIEVGSDKLPFDYIVYQKDG